MDRFPPKIPFWGKDNMVTSWLITVEKRDTKEKENIALTTIMKLQRGSPYRPEKEGKRKIDVKLITWSSKGYSPLLGQSIEYRLSKGINQPISHVEGFSKDEDFPASMVFNAIFDVFIGGKKVASEVKGTARASNLPRIPPDADDLFIVEKDINVDDNIFLISGDCPTRFAITGRQKFLIRLGLLFRIVPAYYRTYLDI